MVVKQIKSFLILAFLVFAFIDAANIVDLFSNTEVIHFEEGTPDSSDCSGLNPSIGSRINFSVHSSSKTILGSKAKKKSSFPKLLIYDQDSPSIIHEVQEQNQSIASIEPSNENIPLTESVSRTLYIENCRLQI